MSEKNKEQKSIFEKVRTAGIKKLSRVVVVIFFIFAMVFATITNLGFKSFDVGTWAANALIMAGILVFGLIMGEGAGLDYYRGLETGIYRANVKQYNEFNHGMKHLINNFDMWYEEALPKELENKKVRFLVKHGIKLITARRIVKYCKLDDLNSLLHDEAIKKHDSETNKDVYIEKVEEHQKDALEWVLSGKIVLDAPNSYYFTVLYNDSMDDVTIFEQGSAIVRTKKKVKNTNRAVRIASSVVFSAVFSALTVYELMGGGDLGAWMNLISRIAGLFTAILSGYMSGKVMVNLEARQIKNKYEVLFRYANDVIKGDYVVKDEQEILKGKYEKQVKKDEEAKKNVIDPEKDKDKVEILDIKPKALENKSNRIELKTK